MLFIHLALVAVLQSVGPDAPPPLDGGDVDPIGDAGAATASDAPAVRSPPDDAADDVDDEDDDAGTRAVREDLPATASSARVKPDEKSAQKPEGDPTFSIWWRSFGLLCAAEGGALLGGLPALVVLGLGGVCVNDAGDRISGRRGTWVTTLAMVGAGVVTLIAGAGSVLVGGALYIAGTGGLGPLLTSREDPLQAAAGAGIMLAGVVGGPALAALLPTWAYLATAEPPKE